MTLWTDQRFQDTIIVFLSVNDKMTNENNIMSLYIIILCDDQIKCISKLLKKTYPLNAVINLTTTVHQSY